MTASTDHEAFREKFMIDQLGLLDDGEWILSVRPGQLTLGSLVLSSARGVADFSGIPANSGTGFMSMLAKAESMAKTLFGATRINAVCLMMQDPVVHFHLLPRYAQPVERYGRVWADQDWPGPPVFRPVTTPREILDALRAGMVEWLKLDAARTRR
jgi:diadenosine tetraphosphate (Ap4A) HIT family hydrolase